MKFLAGLSMCPVTLSYRMAAVAGSAYVVYRAVQMRKRLQTYSTRRQEAEEAKEEAMQDLEDDEEEDITEAKLMDLLADVRTGRTSSLRVVRAYLAKALHATQETNCVTEPIPDVQTVARALDAAQSAGAELGMLHGVPVSIKECVDVKGMCSTIGFAKWCTPASDDAVLVKVLRAQGAVPFVKTNVPQTMVSFDCSNPIYGATVNPLDHTRTPGGSSGGEAALIASGGSLLGLGSDIGGSGRIPAAFCGICGLKPTENRLSGDGFVSALSGQSGVSKSSCVLAKDVLGCRLMMKALCNETMWKLDRRVVPMPFNEDLATTKRHWKVGFYDDDGFFPTTPAYRRAVQEAKAALEAAGHEVVSFTLPDIKEAVSLYYKLIGADDGTTVKGLLKNETVDPSIKDAIRLLTMPSMVRAAVRGVVGMLWPRVYTMVGNVRLRSVAELWKLQKQRQDYRLRVLQAWEALGLDGIITPSHAMGPLPVGQCARLTATCSYTFIFNLLDFPAGVVPVTKVSDADDAALVEYPREDLWTRAVAHYAKGMVDLPVAVQCVTRPWHDEQCLNLMAEVERCVSTEAAQ